MIGVILRLLNSMVSWALGICRVRADKTRQLYLFKSFFRPIVDERTEEQCLGTQKEGYDSKTTEEHVNPTGVSKTIPNNKFIDVNSVDDRASTCIVMN